MANGAYAASVTSTVSRAKVDTGMDLRMFYQSINLSLAPTLFKVVSLYVDTLISASVLLTLFCSSIAIDDLILFPHVS